MRGRWSTSAWPIARGNDPRERYTCLNSAGMSGVAGISKGDRSNESYSYRYRWPCSCRGRRLRSGLRTSAGIFAHTNSSTGPDIVQAIYRNAGRDLDKKAVECCADGMGQGQSKMGRLPETIEGTEALRAKKLVVPLPMHDWLKPKRRALTRNKAM